MTGTIVAFKDGDEDDPPVEQCCGNCMCYQLVVIRRCFGRRHVTEICRLYPPGWREETTADEWCGRWRDAEPEP